MVKRYQQELETALVSVGSAWANVINTPQTLHVDAIDWLCTDAIDAVPVEEKLLWYAASAVLQTSSAGQPVSCMVDSMQLLQPSEVDTMKSCLKRMICLTTLAGLMASRKRTAPASWTEEQSGAKGSKRRALGRSPTEEAVREWSTGEAAERRACPKQC